MKDYRFATHPCPSILTGTGQQSQIIAPATDSQFRKIDNEAEMKTLDVFQRRPPDLMRLRAALKAAIEEESRSYGICTVERWSVRLPSLARRLVEAGPLCHRFEGLAGCAPDNPDEQSRFAFPRLDLATRPCSPTWSSAVC